MTSPVTNTFEANSSSSSQPNFKGGSYRSRKRRAHFIIHIIMFMVSIGFALPVILVVSGSFSSESAISKNGYSLWPQDFSLAAYNYLLADPSQIINAYLVSISVTVVGSVAALLIMALLGYTLARRDFQWRKQLSFLTFFPMLFSGGLVPSYILMTQFLHLQNTLLAYIFPYLVIPVYVLLLRTYFAGLPAELIEAAKIDGAGEWRIFFQIIIPMSTPALATVGLFTMLTFWNDWFLGLLYITDSKLVSLQYLLYQLSTNITNLSNNPQTATIQIPTQSVIMSMAVIAIGPIVFAFFFTQKYFIRGVTMGGLKGD